MTSRLRRRVQWFVVASSAWGTAGCVGQSVTQTAQALPPGETQHVVGFEVFPTDRKEGHDCPGCSVGALPPRRQTLGAVPYYGVRAGFAEGAEVALRITPVITAALDLKWQPVDGRSWDLAVAPGLAVGHNDLSVLLPLLVGYTVNDSLQLNLVGRFAATDVHNTAGEYVPLPDSASWWSAGGTVYYRFSQEFGVIGEAHRGFAFDGEYSPTGSVALSLVFGAHPSL